MRKTTLPIIDSNYIASLSLEDFHLLVIDLACLPCWQDYYPFAANDLQHKQSCQERHCLELIRAITKIRLNPADRNSTHHYLTENLSMVKHLRVLQALYKDNWKDMTSASRLVRLFKPITP